MHALTRTIARAAAPALPRASRAPSRALATEGPPVSWSQYRSGQKTLAEWVDANRHIVAGSMFAFYVGLAAWNLRPGKGASAAPAAAAPAAAAPAAADPTAAAPSS